MCFGGVGGGYAAFCLEKAELRTKRDRDADQRTLKISRMADKAASVVKLKMHPEDADALLARLALNQPLVKSQGIFRC